MTIPHRLFLASFMGCVLLTPARAQFGNLLKSLGGKQPDPAAQAAEAAAQAQAQAAAQAAAKPAREVFSKTVTPEQATAMGLSKLSPEEIAQLDAAVTMYAAQAQAEFSAQMAAAMAGKAPALAGQAPAAAPDESMTPGFLGIPGAPKLGIPGMDGTPVTAESLLESIAGGGQFFFKANLKYAEAILPAERVKEINDMVAALNPKDGQAAVGAVEKMTVMLRERADVMLKEGKSLSDRSKALIAEGNEEIGKGILKWGVLTVMVAKTFKLGGNEEKMVAAIVVAKNAIKDIVDLKKLQGTMAKLAELKDAKPGEAAAAEAKT